MKETRKKEGEKEEGRRKALGFKSLKRKKTTSEFHFSTRYVDFVYILFLL
jgi:hypothetical protein